VNKSDHNRRHESERGNERKRHHHLDNGGDGCVDDGRRYRPLLHGAMNRATAAWLGSIGSHTFNLLYFPLSCLSTTPTYNAVEPSNNAAALSPPDGEAAVGDVLVVAAAAWLGSIGIAH
jgi:hypothetical protein